MVEISTSILQVKKENIIKTIYNLETAHTDYFHIDVMDGEFVERDTSLYMREYSEYIKQISTVPLDVHLMVSDVKTYILSYESLDPNILTFHIEACKNTQQILDNIKLIKSIGARVGIAIKPDTSINVIKEYLDKIHLCLIMTVEPGKGGQEFLTKTANKIKELKNYIDENNLDIDMEVDGGINDETAKIVKQNGANILVSGSYIINHSFKEQIEKLRKVN